jgi:hypothetical protein
LKPKPRREDSRDRAVSRRSTSRALEVSYHLSHRVNQDHAAHLCL